MARQQIPQRDARAKKILSRWELKKLVPIYADIATVNKDFRERLSAIRVSDATVNALANLHCFADFTSFAIEKNHLEEIELLFHGYFE